MTSPLINIRYIWWHHARCAHFAGLVHKTWKLCQLMGQVIHLVLFKLVHSITRYDSKSKCPKSAPSSKTIFHGAALFCEIATSVQYCEKAKMTLQESSDFDCATFAKWSDFASDAIWWPEESTTPRREPAASGASTHSEQTWHFRELLAHFLSWRHLSSFATSGSWGVTHKSRQSSGGSKK